jgi:hypothetical protein
MRRMESEMAIARRSAKNETENVNPVTGEITPAFPVLSTDQLSEIKSFADAIALANEVYGAEHIAVASDVLGDGFRILENKDALSGVGFFAINWTFSMGDHGEFVAMKVVTEDDRKLVLIDGSKGIFEQVKLYSEKTGKYGGLVVRRGLRRSDYTYTDEKGVEKDASTYYLDVSA